MGKRTSDLLAGKSRAFKCALEAVERMGRAARPRDDHDTPTRAHGQPPKRAAHRRGRSNARSTET